MPHGITLDSLFGGLIGAAVGFLGSILVAVVGIAEQRRLWRMDRRREEWREALDALAALQKSAGRWHIADVDRREAERVNQSDVAIRRGLAQGARESVIAACENAMFTLSNRIFIPQERIEKIGLGAVDIWNAIPKADLKNLLIASAALHVEAKLAASADLGIKLPATAPRTEELANLAELGIGAVQ